MTQADLARKANVGQSHISMAINGDRGTSLNTLIKISDATGIDLNVLLGREPGSPPPGREGRQEVVIEDAAPGEYMEIVALIRAVDGKEAPVRVRVRGPMQIIVDDAVTKLVPALAAMACGGGFALDFHQFAHTLSACI